MDNKTLWKNGVILSFDLDTNKLNISPNIEKIDISDEIRKLQDKEWEEEIISTNIVHKAEEELEF